MSPRKKKISEEERATKVIKAFDNLAKTGEIGKSMSDAGLARDLTMATQNLSKDVDFKEAAEAMGFSPADIISKAKELYDKPVVKRDKNGNMIEFEDPNFQLKVLQFVSIFAHQTRDQTKRTEHKHLHLHNKTNAELDKLLRVED